MFIDNDASDIMSATPATGDTFELPDGTQIAATETITTVGQYNSTLELVALDATTHVPTTMVGDWDIATAGETYASRDGRFKQGTTSLTDASATVFAKVTMASGSTWAGQVQYKLEGTDGTEFSTIGGHVEFTAINKAGTITCSTPVNAATADLSTGAATSTLTAFTCADAGSGVLNLLANFTTSVTDTTNWPKIYHKLESTEDQASYVSQ